MLLKQVLMLALCYPVRKGTAEARMEEEAALTLCRHFTCSSAKGRIVAWCGFVSGGTFHPGGTQRVAYGFEYETPSPAPSLEKS